MRYKRVLARGNELENIFKKADKGVEAIIDTEEFRTLWIQAGNTIF